MIEVDAALLLATAVLFSLVSGVNDGATILSLSTRVRRGRRLAFGAMVLAVAVMPLVVGTGVATTLAGQLVDFAGEGGRAQLAAAALCALVVSLAMARSGVPTSLTLALIGGILGAGIGAGAGADPTRAAVVLAVAALAPLAGGLLAVGLVRLTAALPLRLDPATYFRRLNVGGFVLVCVAYAANDAQKMLALVAVALGTAAPTVTADPRQLALVAALFAVGALLGVRRISRTLSSRLVLARPSHVAFAGASAGTAVLASTALAAPVSMTQAIAGALVGSTQREGLRRVRWRVALRLVLGWVLTLPAALGLAAALVAVLDAMGGL